MRRLLVVVLAAAAILVTPATALAKGPSAASISGPGLSAPLRVDGRGDLGGPGQLGGFMQHAGFSEGVWGPQAGLTAMDEPEGELGPRYIVSWTLSGPTGVDDTVRQDLYPYAGPVRSATSRPGSRSSTASAPRAAGSRAAASLSALLFDLGLREPVFPATTPGSLVLAGLGGAILAAVWAAGRGRRRPAALPG